MKKARGARPKGEYAGKASWLSTRITGDLRAKLEGSAQKCGRSLSQEVEHRLRRSFEAGREYDLEPFLRALQFLINEAVERKLARQSETTDLAALINQEDKS
jgi:hypothetical protein